MTLGLKPVPQILPALLIERKSIPLVIPAAVSQASIPAFTQSGTGMVRMWPPLPIRSAITQCSSLLYDFNAHRSQFRPAEPATQQNRERCIVALFSKSLTVGCH